MTLFTDNPFEKMMIQTYMVCIFQQEIKIGLEVYQLSGTGGIRTFFRHLVAECASIRNISWPLEKQPSRF